MAPELNKYRFLQTGYSILFSPILHKKHLVWKGGWGSESTIWSQWKLTNQAAVVPLIYCHLKIGHHHIHLYLIPHLGLKSWSFPLHQVSPKWPTFLLWNVQYYSGPCPQQGHRSLKAISPLLPTKFNQFLILAKKAVRFQGQLYDPNNELSNWTDSYIS